MLTSFFKISILGAALFFVFGAFPGCRQIDSDQLYALYLTSAPTAADWERAMPHQVAVKGGRLHRRETLVDIDSDSVHTSTASCHHGSSLPDPITVDLRAFYTETDLYLRLSWDDATRDDAMNRWIFDGREWSNQGGSEDGFGLLWDAQGRFPAFTCSYACHLKDFGVSRSSFHATNTMAVAQDGAWLDLWNWKADRTGRFSFADDRYLDQKGMHGDVPGELIHPNSRLAIQEGKPESAFSPGDQPVTADDGRTVSGEVFVPGDTAPGYLIDVPSAGRADISALSEWHDGTWSVVLKRKLRTGDVRDVQFVPADEAGVAFGLSLMDNSLNEHYASTVEERLVLLPKEAGAIVSEKEK